MPERPQYWKVMVIKAFVLIATGIKLSMAWQESLFTETSSLLYNQLGLGENLACALGLPLVYFAFRELLGKSYLRRKLKHIHRSDKKQFQFDLCRHRMLDLEALVLFLVMLGTDVLFFLAIGGPATFWESFASLFTNLALAIFIVMVGERSMLYNGEAWYRWHHHNNQI